jgi:hypothetical protein
MGSLGGGGMSLSRIALASGMVFSNAACIDAKRTSDGASGPDSSRTSNSIEIGANIFFFFFVALSALTLGTLWREL